jgi:hypothetical protein
MPYQARYAIREEYMQAMIDDIFAGFNRVFSVWEKSLHNAYPEFDEQLDIMPSSA